MFCVVFCFFLFNFGCEEKCLFCFFFSDLIFFFNKDKVFVIFFNIFLVLFFLILLMFFFVVLIYFWFFCIFLLVFWKVCNLIVWCIVLFKFIGCVCFIFNFMLGFFKVFMNCFLVSIFLRLIVVVGYVKFVSLWIFCFNFGRDFIVFCFFFCSWVLYNFVWFVGVNFFFSV